MPEKKARVRAEPLQDFCVRVFEKMDVPEEDARITAGVLVTANLRGVDSHGVARLRRYVNGLRDGMMIARPDVQVVTETPTTALIDAGDGLGQPVSYRAMEKAIQKALDLGAGFVTVRNSNHYGIAGYYAMMALEKDMLGIAMTNTAALGVPTFGRHVMFGTNPLAFAAPADRERAFVLDMSTTVVTRGKIEVYDRKEEPLPRGWAVDKHGKTATDARQMLDDMLHRYGGGILPLGGEGEAFGGYKGYGMAIMIDILCAVLGGAPFGTDVCDTEVSSARVAHFFGAIRIDAFREASAFRRDMDTMLERLRACPTAEGAERVYFAGEKEFEHERICGEQGVPVMGKTYEMLCSVAQELAVEPPAVTG